MGILIRGGIEEMKKTLKKFALISMSAMTVAAVAPIASISAQVNNSESTTVAEEAKASSETTEGEVAEEEGSDLQKAFKDAVEKFKETYPEVEFTGVTIKPLEEKEEASSEEASSEETTVEESTMAEASTEAEGEEATEEEKVYEIELVGRAAEEEVSAKYDSSTGEEIVEDPMAETSSEETTVAGEMAEEVASEEITTMAGETEAEDSLTAESSEEGMVAPHEGEVLPIDLEAIKPLDEVTKLAEETAGFGEAYEWELTANPTDPETAVWFVKVAENPEKPEEGKQGEVSIDATTLEVLATSGDITLDSAESGSKEASDSQSGEDKDSGESGESGETGESGEDEETSAVDGSEEASAEETSEGETTQEGEASEQTTVVEEGGQETSATETAS